MAGRPSKSTELILMEGKSHRTKKEIEHRKKSEKALSTGSGYVANTQVKSDKIAMKEFNRLKRLYKNITFVEGLDEQIINRYCLIIAEEHGIRRLIDKMNNDIDQCEEFSDRMKLYETIDGCLIRIKQLREMLLKLEDRLFLNPVARMKAIPKKPPEEKEIDPMAALFNNSKPHKSG